MALKEPEAPKTHDPAYRYRSWAWIIAILATPVVSIAAAVLTAYTTTKSISSQSNVEMAKLAISVLQAPGILDEKTSAHLRRWSLDTLGILNEINASAVDQAVKRLDAIAEVVSAEPDASKGTTLLTLSAEQVVELASAGEEEKAFLLRGLLDQSSGNASQRDPVSPALCQRWADAQRSCFEQRSGMASVAGKAMNCEQWSTLLAQCY